jgi:hypothetical protein
MIKEFEINDILNAVNSISETDIKKTKMSKNKDEDNENDVTTHNKQKKSDESEILVLDQMIE